MKNKHKIGLAVFIASLILTYFLFVCARVSAVAARGTTAAFGGEFLVLLTPAIVWIAYQNIVLSIEAHKNSKAQKKSKQSSNGIKITGIKNIEVVK